MTLYVGEHFFGDDAHCDVAGQVVALPVALVSKVEGVLLLEVTGVTSEDYLTHEGVTHHILTVDLRER